MKRLVVQVNDFVQGHKLVDIEILSGRYLKTPPVGFAQFRQELDNFHIDLVGCYGKFISWSLDRSRWHIFSTLGMTGTYKTEEDEYSRIAFDLSDGTSVYYSDMRNFGTLKFVNSIDELNKKLATLGPDMLSNPCDEETWLKRIHKYDNRTLVWVLMNQKIFSGVGNIYKSESLYLAKLMPSRTVGSCSEQQLLRLREAVIKVLNNAYEMGGATIRNYSDLFGNKGGYMGFESESSKEIAFRPTVMVYNQKKDPLGNVVHKITLDDKRTTYYVPECQI